ncbi:MAG: hypothetical protein ACK5MA_06645 [Parachlamydiaceae bacterium]
MSIDGFSSGVGRPSHGPIPAVIKEGYDELTKTETISEDKLRGMHKETFWDSLEVQGAKKLVIVCKEGKKVTYEKGFFTRLLENKPELADLTQFFKVEFSDGSEEMETKAKLCMCGKTLENIFGDIQFENVPLPIPLVSPEDFQGVLHAIENEAEVISTYPKEVQHAMNYFDFHPAGVPEGVHGKRDWNARGVDVGEVPPLPKELSEALNKPCPIAKDGSKMIDTHVILWMPPTLNGEPISVNTLERMAQADAFGENEIGYEVCESGYRTNAVINQPLERGYWLALYKKPVAESEHFEEIVKYIKENCPGYEMPKVREVIASCVMQYGCSGDQKERILARENDACYCICEEPLEPVSVWVGSFAPSGLKIDFCLEGYDIVGVCPVKRFYP